MNLTASDINLSVSEIEEYLDRIYSLKSEIIDKDFKISLLEFELAMEKNLVKSLKAIYQETKSYD